MIYYINLTVYKINYAGQFDLCIYIYLRVSYKSIKSMKLVKDYRLYFINTDIVKNVSFTVIPYLL